MLNFTGHQENRQEQDFCSKLGCMITVLTVVGTKSILVWKVWFIVTPQSV